MDWKEVLKDELSTAYRTAGRLMDMVEPSSLGWKPMSGQSWMTVAQLLKHISAACGPECKGFVKGDWGPPAGGSGDSGLPPAEKMPSVSSVAEAKQLLAADQELALRMLAAAEDDQLDHQPAPAPWDPTKMPLGRRLLEVVRHLDTHKSQLFYYLKLQGQPVHTGHLWGM